MKTGTVLVISGFDPYNLAGYGADIRIITKAKAFPIGVITALTSQTPSVFCSSYPVGAAILDEQLDLIFSNNLIDVIKIGMVYNSENINVIFKYLHNYQGQVVVDPVICSTTKKPLLKQESLDLFCEKILKRASLITPNLPEALCLTNQKEDVEKTVLLDMFFERFKSCTLLKGGHGTLNDEGEFVDLFYDGVHKKKWSRKKNNVVNTHGTGCFLASAISAFLAKGMAMSAAISAAEDFLSFSLENSLEVEDVNYLSYF